MDTIINFLKPLIIMLLAVFAPVQAMLLTAGVLIIADLVTGLLAAHKQKIPITSAGIRRTISKMFIYQTAIMLGFLVETYMAPGIPISSIVAGVIGITELTSVLENLSKISDNAVISNIITKLGSANDKKD